MSTKRDALVAALGEEGRIAANRAVLLHNAVAAAAKINPTDFNCLAVLDAEGPMPAGRLAEWIGLTKGGAITAAIDRMERAGLVRRVSAPGDRRRVNVELVRDGAYQKFVRAFDDSSHVYATLFADYSDDDLALVLEFYRRVNGGVSTQIRDLHAGS